MNYLGEMMALLGAFCWVGTSISFEKAGKKVGSLAVNVIRIFLGFLFLTITSTLTRSMPLPLDAPFKSFTFLSLSGFLGMFLGDLFLFEAFVLVGARISMLIMSLAPALTALLAYIILGETLNLQSLFGLIIVLIGVIIVIFQKKEGEGIKLKHSKFGVFCALMGVVGQSAGNILSKIGVSVYDPISSTQIRVLTAMIAFVIYVSLIKKWPVVINALKDKSSLKGIFIGSIWGPFLGVLTAILAFKYTKAGIASTILSINPVLIIPFSIFYLKEKVNFIEIIGAVLTVFGVILFFV